MQPSPEARCREFARDVHLEGIPEEWQQGVADGLKQGLAGTGIMLDSIVYDPAGLPDGADASACTAENTITYGPKFLKTIKENPTPPPPLSPEQKRRIKQEIARCRETAALSHGEERQLAEWEAMCFQQVLDEYVEREVLERAWVSDFGKTCRERAALITAHECGHVIDFQYQVDLRAAEQELSARGIIVARPDYLRVSCYAGRWDAIHCGDDFAEIHAAICCGYGDKLSENITGLYRLAMKAARVPQWNGP